MIFKEINNNSLYIFFLKKQKNNYLVKQKELFPE
jgi:hypothetical protein